MVVSKIFVVVVELVVVAEELVVLVVLPVELVVHMYVAGSVVQCPSPVHVAVMVTLGNKSSSQVKVMDDPSNVVV